MELIGHACVEWFCDVTPPQDPIDYLEGLPEECGAACVLQYVAVRGGCDPAHVSCLSNPTRLQEKSEHV